MTITLRGNYDPVFALRVRERNMAVGEVDYRNPEAMNMHQADLEKQQLESPYQGARQGAQGHRGVARPREAEGVGRFADDLLNAQSRATGMSFRPVTHPAGHEVVRILDEAFANGMQVPIVVGEMSNPNAHYMLVQDRRVSGTHVEYSIRDPWSGETSWVNATDIANGTMPGKFPFVSSVEVPTALPTEHGKAPHAETPIKAEAAIEPNDVPGAGKARVTTRTPGVFESIDPHQTPPSIHSIEHKDLATVEADVRAGKKVTLTTEVTVLDRNNKKIVGSMSRSYDPKTKSLVLHHAFLPDELPRTVRHDPPLDPANPANGVPLASYIQMQQFKIFNLAPGEVQHMSARTVYNVVTIVQLEIASRDYRVDVEHLPSEAIERSHSVEYIETPLVQSGHRIVNAKISGGGHASLRHFLEQMRSEGYLKSVARAEELMREHGLKEEDKVYGGFNIDAEVVPEQSKPPR
jgi:hypothetical protein